jgi:hypothetical protein
MRGYKKGDWYVVDQESGLVEYASDVAQDWTGKYVKKQWMDYENQQDFVKPLKDPKPLPYYSPLNFPTTIATASAFVGKTNVPTSPFGVVRR